MKTSIFTLTFHNFTRTYSIQAQKTKKIKCVNSAKISTKKQNTKTIKANLFIIDLEAQPLLFCEICTFHVCHMRSMSVQTLFVGICHVFCHHDQ